jgi:hypothetical protein
MASGRERKRGWRWKDEEGVRGELVVGMSEDSVRRTPGASWKWGGRLKGEDTFRRASGASWMWGWCLEGQEGVRA